MALSLVFLKFSLTDTIMGSFYISDEYGVELTEFICGIKGCALLA